MVRGNFSPNAEDTERTVNQKRAEPQKSLVHGEPLVAAQATTDIRVGAKCFACG